MAVVLQRQSHTPIYTDESSNDESFACDDHLMIATDAGDMEEVKRLIEAGADLNIQEEDGYTPLMIAVVHGNIELVKFLIEAGADVDIENNNGETVETVALDQVMFDGHSQDILDILLYGGPDDESCDEE